MIGQKILKEQFNKFSISNLPKSILFVGAVGSGRKTFVHYVGNKLNVQVLEIGSGVEDIRELSVFCSKQFEPMIYLISDVEQMSASAQNALLKILEEPPNSAYFMLTTVQENMVLSTIHSRCMTYQMGPYSYEDLIQYLADRYPEKYLDATVKNAIKDICNCPGDIDLLLSQDVKAFLEYVQLTFDNIAVVSGANSFKIGSKINLADDDSKYNLRLFWRAFISLCLNKTDTLDRKQLQGASITAKYYADLQIKSMNKAIAFDNWILDIRKAWM